MMKKLTLLGMIAAVAIVGLSVTGCGGSSSSYMAMAFEVTQANFTAAITASTASSATTPEGLIDLNQRDVAEDVALRLRTLAWPNSIEEDEGLSMSDMRAFLQGEGIPPGDISLLVNTLSRQGFVVAGMELPNGRIGIVAASRE